MNNNGMKKHVLLTIIVYLTAVFFGCSSSKNTTSSSNKASEKVVDDGYGERLAKDANQSNVMVKPNEDRKSNISLDDMIRRLPGVQVSGSGRNARIKISGAESFMSGTDPLFVLNGNPMPNFAQLYSVVNPNDVASVTVLKGSDATIYGSRGANGVIVIRTKK
jgi:TonB-dependent SusC/RagA subfamily outer membrane receptor